MKICVVIIIVSLILTKSTAEWSAETQTTEVDDKTTITHLSNTVNEITSNLVKIVENIGSSYADDLELLAYPIKDIISLIWNTPSDKLYRENIFFLFDKLLDIVYLIYERLDDVWHGASYLIESKLSQISMCSLQIVDEMKTLGEQSEDNDLDTKFTAIKKAMADLTTSVVGLTSITTSIAQLITTRDRSVSLIVETITSLILIHQYVVAAVACLLSRAAIYSPDPMHVTGIATLTTTIVNFISNLRAVTLNEQKGATKTQLFHGELHVELSLQLLVSMNGLMSTKMINVIYTSTASLSTIVQEYAPRAFHVLPDLIDQLAMILLRCGHTKFGSLDMCITYAFDGLFDVLNHISYKLDKHIQSSASTGSFQEPSEPIDTAVANVRIEVKRFIHRCQALSKCDTEELTTHLIASTSDLMQALLDPMNIVIQKSDNDYSITLASSLQFIALYVVGLILTPLISLTKSLQNSTVIHTDTYSNFGAMLSLLFVKIQMIFDFSVTQNATDLLKRLYESFDDLLQYVTHHNGAPSSSRASHVINVFVELAVNRKVGKPFTRS